MEIKVATLLCAILLIVGCSDGFLTDVGQLPLVVTTWPYEDAVNAGKCFLTDHYAR